VGQLVQPPALVAEAVHEPADPPARPGRQPRAADAQCERQPFAEADQLLGVGLLGTHAPVADYPVEQRERRRGVERVEVDVVRAGQVAEPDLAGGDHRAAGAAGQQRQGLLLGGDVVEHDQHPLAGERAAVQGGPLVDCLGHGPAGDAECAEEPGELVGRVAVALAEVGVELPVGKVRGDLVRDPYREARLADPTPPGHRDDGHRVAGRLLGEDADDAGDLGLPSGEVGDAGGHLLGHGGCDAGFLLFGPLELVLTPQAPLEIQRGVPVEDGQLQVTQLLAGFDADLVDEDVAGVPVGGECLGGAAGAVQRDHE
jgi:hypothetical protein